MKNKNIGFWYLQTFLSSLCGCNMIIIEIGENNEPYFIISITCLQIYGVVFNILDKYSLQVSLF
jgi:hypothetical protein